MENIFSAEEVDALIKEISRVDGTGPAFRKSNELFAIRRFLQEVPAIQPLIFTTRLNEVIKAYIGSDYFAIKSIYFDKPAASNWFVAWHQDLTISVDKKMDLPGFGPWTVKQDQFGVQPPQDILEHIFTIRIHLDDTDENNGALKVIPGSHLKGVCRTDAVDWKQEEGTICTIKKGGIMIMRPLLWHSSGRTVNERKRRVIHIEFSNRVLAGRFVCWGEAL